jgi:GNAT superfamily N-acetyltransferase
MLPDGFTSRPAEWGDLDAVAALVSVCERADLDKTLVTKEDIAAEWSQPNFDLGSDAIVLLLGGSLVAHAETFRTRGEVAIHPDVRGRGLGTWILEWIEERGRVKGEAKSRQTILDRNLGAAAMLRSHGYEVGYVSWVLEIELGEEPTPPKPPPGVRLRKFVAGKDDQNLYRVIEDAFTEWPDREANSFEDWAAAFTLRPTFDPELVDLAEDEGGNIVGGSVGLEYEGEGGWIQQLAVRSSHRNRGIARALLHQAFLTAWRRGKPTCGVSTDSRTGALGLYEQVGMHVTATATNFVKSL